MCEGSTRGNTESAQFIPCKISVESVPNSSGLSSVMHDRYEMFMNIFKDIDGSSVSQKDRLRSGDLDTLSFSYGEIGM